MKGFFKLINFFLTTLDVDLDTATTGTITVKDKIVDGYTLVDGEYNFYIVVDLPNKGARELFRIWKVEGKILHYDKRISPMGIYSHEKGVIVQINDVAELLNALSKNIDNFGEVDEKSNLDIKVYGGDIKYDGTSIVIPNIDITLTDNNTNHIILNYLTGIIESVIDLTGLVYYKLSTIITSSGIIISITDDRSKILESGAFLISDGDGTQILHNDGTYKAIVTTDAILDDGIITNDKVYSSSKIESVVSNSISGINIEVNSTSLNYMLGGTGTVGKAYSLNPYEQTVVGTSNDFGSVVQKEVAQSFFGQDIYITELKFMIQTISSPSDNIFIEIQTDNSGVPSGTTIANGTSDLINYTALSGTFTEETFIFASVPVITAETLYHIVLKRTGANDAVNYYAAESAGSDVQIGTASLNTGSWANATDDLYFKMSAGYSLITLGGTNFIGILQLSGTAGQIRKANKDYDNNQTGLTIGSYYGFNISTGTIEAGNEFKAISTTELSFDTKIESVSSTKASATLGETVAKGDALRFGSSFIEVPGNDTTVLQDVGASSWLTFYNTATYSETGQSILTTKAGLLTNISVWLAKNNSPTNTITIEVYSNSAFTTLLAKSTNSIAASSLTTSSVKYTFNFTDFNVSNGQTLYFKIDNGTGTHNISNYVNIYYSNSSVYASGNMWTRGTGVWINITTYDLRFEFIVADTEDTTKIFKTAASSVYKIDAICFADQAGIIDDVIVIRNSGVETNKTGLTIGSDYYLSNTAGAISTSAGTNSVKIGKAISATELLINFQQDLVMPGRTKTYYTGSTIATTNISLVTLHEWTATKDGIYQVQYRGSHGSNYSGTVKVYVGGIPLLQVSGGNFVNYIGILGDMYGSNDASVLYGQVALGKGETIEFKGSTSNSSISTTISHVSIKGNT